MNLTVNVTHRHRRLAVLGFVGGFLGSLLLRTFTGQFDVLAIGLQLLGLLCTGFLLSWGIPRLKEKQLDERQRQVRNDAYFKAYLVLSVVTLAVPILLTLLFLVSEQTARALIATLLASFERPVDFVTIFGVLTPFVVFLPWAMLAWLEPDPLPDDEALLLNSVVS